jgi:hypothetical protein
LNPVTEVYEQPVVDAGGDKVVNKLHFMFRSESDNRFDLDYQLPIYPEIREVQTDSVAVVPDRKVDLLANINSLLF